MVVVVGGGGVVTATVAVKVLHVDVPVADAARRRDKRTTGRADAGVGRLVLAEESGPVRVMVVVRRGKVDVVPAARRTVGGRWRIEPTVTPGIVQIR